MPQVLLRGAPDQFRDACSCIEPSPGRGVSIDLDRAERLGLSIETFWSCGPFLMKMSGAEERKVSRAFVAIPGPGWRRQIASEISDAESPARAFAKQSGLAMFTAGGRKLGTMAGMP